LVGLLVVWVLIYIVGIDTACVLNKGL